MCCWQFTRLHVYNLETFHHNFLRLFSASVGNALQLSESRWISAELCAQSTVLLDGAAHKRFLLRIAANGSAGSRSSCQLPEQSSCHHLDQCRSVQCHCHAAKFRAQLDTAATYSAAEFSDHWPALEARSDMKKHVRLFFSKLTDTSGELRYKRECKCQFYCTNKRKKSQ